MGMYGISELFSVYQINLTNRFALQFFFIDMYHIKGPRAPLDHNVNTHTRFS